MVQAPAALRPNAQALCTVSGCDKRAHARGLCDKHRTQIRRHGRLTPERELGRPRPKLPCRVDDCEAVVVARELCSRHYSQMRRHGRILPESRRPRSRDGQSIFDLLEDLEVFVHGRPASPPAAPRTSFEPLPLRSGPSANAPPGPGASWEDGMTARVDTELTRLLGMASVDISHGVASSVREGLRHEEQRLLDGFRMMHAHRLGRGDPAATAKLAGLTEPQVQRLLEVTLASPTGSPAEGFAGRHESLDFAWLLGLYAAIRRSPAGRSPRPLRVRLDAEEAEELSGKMEALFGRAPSIREVDDQFDVFFGSKELSRYLHEVTHGNTQVPWEHLVTPGERREFLRSFLKRRCSLSAIGGVRPILAVGKRMSSSLRDGLLFLFAQMGIYPAFDDSRIFLQALPELERVLELGLIVSPERHERLAQLVKHAPYDSLDIEVDLYYRVLAGEDTDLVPAETRRRWFLDELPPKIKRVERIAALLRETVDPDAVGLLFRGLQLSSADARELAGRSSLRQVLSIVTTLTEAKIPQESWSHWLGLSPEDIAQKLGGVSSPIIDVYGRRFRLSPRARMRYLQAYGLQPSEYEDFDICLEHIRDELREALDSADEGGRLESSSLVFSIQGQDIQSIRLVSHG